MTIQELAKRIEEYLHFEDYKADISLNGLQVCGEPEKEVRKAAFAVDASLLSMKRAIELNADILFVHHGMFWGAPIAVKGAHFKRIKTMIDGALSLFASHIPLDAHPVIGNNAQIAKCLSLQNLQQFSTWRGMSIGFKGTLPNPLTVQEIIKALNIPDNPHNAIIRGGKELNRTVAVVSGGAAEDVNDAINEGIDCFITGDSSHTQYHTALEAGINMLSLGHYQTETFGIKALGDYIHSTYGIDTVFIDIPTGL